MEERNEAAYKQMGPMNYAHHGRTKKNSWHQNGIGKGKTEKGDLQNP